MPSVYNAIALNGDSMEYDAETECRPAEVNGSPVVRAEHVVTVEIDNKVQARQWRAHRFADRDPNATRPPKPNLNLEDEDD